jgi:hypothetical protein
MQLKTLLLLVFASFLFANEVTTQQLFQEIQDLQQEIQTLKTQKNKDYNELYDYTESVETKILEDKIKFSLGLRFGDDFITKKYADGTQTSSNNILTTKFMLGLRANITQTLKFHGRLSMYKYWGSSLTHPYSYYDNMQGRVPSNSALYVERAYIDYFFLNNTRIPMALTIGRQPSTDGPSHQFKDNLQRKATYSALLYDGVADGAVLTCNLSKILHHKKTYLRFGYSKGFGYVESTSYTPNAYIGAYDSDIADTNLYGIFFDTTLSNIPNSLIQISYSYMKDIIANPLDMNYTNNKNIGNMELIGAMIELTDFQEKNIDLYAHFGYNKSTPNNQTYQDPNGNTLGLLDDGATQHSGYAYWLGTRYSFGENNHYKIGAEYNHGSKYWVSLTQGGYDLYNKLATRGDAVELYGMLVANRYLNFRLGYIGINYDYTGSGWFIGKPHTPQNDELTKLHTFYLKMNMAY